MKFGIVISMYDEIEEVVETINSIKGENCKIVTIQSDPGDKKKRLEKSLSDEYIMLPDLAGSRKEYQEMVEKFKKGAPLPIAPFAVTRNFSKGFSMIKKFDTAIKNKKNDVSFWGDGSAIRDLLYVDDAVDAIIRLTESYDSDKPINIGSGMKIEIKGLVEKISNLMGFSGKIIWDLAGPGGPRRIFLDSSRAENELGWKAKTSIDDGLKKTIEHFVR